MRGFLVAVAIGTLAVGWWPAAAQPSKLAAKDSADIQDCIKSKPGKEEACIGIVSDPCLDRDDTKSTADMNACVDRERVVWDDILNETFEKLRDMQRAWITSKDKSCAFYWDYFQGTMAGPMAASCVNRETARRALFLLGFLVDAENNK